MDRKHPAGPPMTLGYTSVSCRKGDLGGFNSVADDLEALVARRPGLMEVEIAKTLFANEGDLQRVNSICRRLIAEGRIKRSGTGTVTNPFTYSPKPACWHGKSKHLAGPPMTLGNMRELGVCGKRCVEPASNSRAREASPRGLRV